MDMTVRNGTRCSAAKAYLYEARKRPNLTVIQQALATRILFEGTRAIGVEYERAGQLHQLHAAREDCERLQGIVDDLLDGVGVDDAHAPN